MYLNYHVVTNTFTGHGRVAFELAKQLMLRGVKLHWYPTHFTHGANNNTCIVPKEFVKLFRRGVPTERAFMWQPYGSHFSTMGNVIYQVHETDTYKYAEVHEYNRRASCVLTPSTWGANILRENGIRVPVDVLPHGVSPDFAYSPIKLADQPIIFAANGRMGSEPSRRKNLDLIIKAFQSAFPHTFDGSIQLWIKTFEDTPQDNVILATRDPRVRVFAKFMSQKELARWYREVTVFINVSGGEGWCMPLHEAMAVGRPTVTMNYGGQTEYVTPDTSWFVPHTLHYVDRGFYKGSHLAVPDYEALVEILRSIPEDLTVITEKSVHATRRAHQFSWNSAGAKLYNILKQNDMFFEDEKEEVAEEPETKLN